LSELRARLVKEQMGTLGFQCSPYYVNSAFYPIIDYFERALKFGRDEAPDAKLDNLEAPLVGDHGWPRGDVHFAASVLSIRFEERYGAVTMDPQKFKDETLRAVVDIVKAAARKQPTVMLFEDAHLDPTALEKVPAPRLRFRQQRHVRLCRPCAQSTLSETCDLHRLTIGDRYRGLVRPGPVDSLSGPRDIAVPAPVLLNVERKRLIHVNPLVDED
jgi:hypothetical protein